MSLLLAFLTACAFSLPFELLDTAEIGVLMPGHTLLEELTAFLTVLGKRMYPQCILLFLLFLLLYRTLLAKIRNKHFSLSAFAAACLFTFYLLAGECGYAYKDLSVLYRTMPQCVISGLKIIGWLPLFYVVIRAGFAALDTRKDKEIKGNVYPYIFEKHSFLLPLLIILICWVPYIIAFYPGFVPSDGLKQLNNYFGSGNFTDHHPAFSSFLMGWAMRLGRKLGSDNLGIFLFTGPQTLVCAAVMAGCFPLFKDMKTPAQLRALSLISFALLPIWPNYAYSLLKDSSYMVLMLLFTILLIRLILNPEIFCLSFRNMALLTVTLALMMLVRHEGKYVAAVIFLLLFFQSEPRKQWKKLLPVILIPFCLIIVFDHVIRPSLNIQDAPFREAITMPIRQTSSIVVEREESLTEEEIRTLKIVFDYERIPEMYLLAFDNADELKGLFDPWALKQSISDYLKLWIILGMKNPLSYLNVLFCSTVRYTDPFLGPYRDIYGWFGIEQAEYVNQGLFDISYASSTSALRSALINFSNALPQLPFTSLFYSLGLNVWCIIFCFIFLLRKKKPEIIIPLMPELLTFIIVHNSAINGFFRYMLPLLITFPLTAAWTMKQRDLS